MWLLSDGHGDGYQGQGGIQAKPRQASGRLQVERTGARALPVEKVRMQGNHTSQFLSQPVCSGG